MSMKFYVSPYFLVAFIILFLILENERFMKAFEIQLLY